MRIISTLLLIMLLAFASYPYTQIYFLNEAIQNSDQVALTKLIDLEAVKTAHKRTLEHSVKNNVVLNETSPILSDIVTEGVELAGNVVASTIDYNWVSQHLQNENSDTFIESITFAFFESPTLFTIRIGELWENPTYVQMQLKGWKWQVVGIYE